MGRAEDARAARGSSALFPRVAFLFPPSTYLVPGAPRAAAGGAEPEAGGQEFESRHLRTRAREEVEERSARECVRAPVAGPRRRHRLWREGKASRGAGWRLDRPSVTSSGPRSGAAPCRLLACQGARQGGAHGSEWERATGSASPRGRSPGRMCRGYLRAPPLPPPRHLGWRRR